MRPLTKTHGFQVLRLSGADSNDQTVKHEGAAFTADDDALRFPVPQHGVVRGVGHGENVRRQLAQSPILVEFDIFRVVNRVELERVDGDQDGADVCVNVTGLEAGAQVLHQRLLVEVRQLAQVRILAIFGLVQEPVKVVANQLRVRVDAVRPVRVAQLLAQIEPVLLMVVVVTGLVICRSGRTHLLRVELAIRGVPIQSIRTGALHTTNEWQSNGAGPHSQLDTAATFFVFWHRPVRHGPHNPPDRPPPPRCQVRASLLTRHDGCILNGGQKKWTPAVGHPPAATTATKRHEKHYNCVHSTKVSAAAPHQRVRPEKKLQGRRKIINKQSQLPACCRS